MAHRLGFYGDGISFRVVLSQSFWLRVLPGGAHLVQPRWMPERILGGGRICGVSFWPFLNSSGWWWLISSVFLTRTSCSKTTHADGYYGAWPGWAISVSVLPLTIWFKENIKCDIKSWYTKPADLSSILSTYDLLLSESFQWEGQLDVHNHMFVAVFFRPLTHLQKSLQPLSLYPLSHSYRLPFLLEHIFLCLWGHSYFNDHSVLDDPCYLILMELIAKKCCETQMMQ